MNTIRALIADDHTLIRAGLRLLLQGLSWVEVVAEAGDGREALYLTQTFHPDVVLMDIAMKGMNGLEATLQIKRSFPRTRIIMLSMFASEEHVLQALRAGASGYLLKDAASIELELALRAVYRGEMYLSPPISKQVIEAYMQRIGRTEDAFALLTARQREILQLIAEGYSNKEIAQRLKVSLKTVETHRAQLMERLNIHNLPGLVRYAIRMGLASLDK
jgi:DNA-binding NarL/FixJ family response regulator